MEDEYLIKEIEIQMVIRMTTIVRMYENLILYFFGESFSPILSHIFSVVIVICGIVDILVGFCLVFLVPPALILVTLWFTKIFPPRSEANTGKHDLPETAFGEQFNFFYNFFGAS